MIKVKADSIIHVIVATGEWGQDGLRYRRHRLAEFLASDPETKEVIWVCPSASRHTAPFQPITDRMKQLTIPDVLKSKFFRFGRYQDMFYIHKLSLFLSICGRKKRRESLFAYGIRFRAFRSYLLYLNGNILSMTAVTCGESR